ncbi:sugar phosphate isomerase/epimerase family protein [Pseudoclostridium thermosuccinogenes]|uniref:sugar phosphate isomerase/epimerase family protein n=1 Tax=Clostridium thermosuccinogenes TaxID=84032 RepID=UPI002FD9690D
MKLSVSAWCLEKLLFGNKMDIPDFIRLCNQNGVEYVELLDCFLKKDEDIQKAKELLGELGMKVSAYSIGNDFVQPDEEARRKEIEAVKKGVDVACSLNTKLLRVFSGSPKEGIAFEDASGWIIDSLKECARYAEEKGITMVLENHGLFAGKGSQVKEIIVKVGSENLKANTDLGNFLLVNEDPFMAVRELKDYVGFVHFKDFKEVGENEPGYKGIDGRKYQGTIIGQGQVPMKEVVDFLHENGYDGFLSIEYEGIGDPVTETIESIKYTKSIIK